MAVRGVGRDGHDYVDDAIRAGASAIILERPDANRREALCIRVRDSRVALAKLAAAFHDLTNGAAVAMPLIGVTGTNGKTTVTWLLRSILRAASHRPAMIGTIEYDLIGERRAADMTTPGPLDLCRLLGSSRRAGATHGVLEVSSHALDQHRCDGLRFSAGVFTNLTGDHLDYHQSMDAYGAAKRRLFGLLPEDAVAVINADDAMGGWMAAGSKARVISYGVDASSADLRAQIEMMDRHGSRFVIQSASFKIEISLSLLGRHNILNALAAAATASGLGVSTNAIRTGIEDLKGVPGRLQRVEPAGHPFSVVVDYAHTDDALSNVLRTLRPLTRGRLICVFGCGGDRDRTKRPRMAKTVEALANSALVTSDNPRREKPAAIIEDILAGFSSSHGCHVTVEVDRRRAIELAIHSARPDDTILIAGKGHETYQLVGDQVLPFDDAEVARQCLAESVA